MAELQTATFAGGCFWCTEAIFRELKGVDSVISGYSGGTVPNPTYEQVSAGQTGHAEAIEIKFDPELISYKVLLEVFWHTHDPTSMNRQGNDEGPQYRSAVFYHNEDQKKIAEETKLELQKDFPKPIVTEITEFTNFYPAEDYHQDYYKNNPNYPYCKFVIDPKLNKLRSQYNKLLAAPIF